MGKRYSKRGKGHKESRQHTTHKPNGLNTTQLHTKTRCGGVRVSLVLCPARFLLDLLDLLPPTPTLATPPTPPSLNPHSNTCTHTQATRANHAGARVVGGGGRGQPCPSARPTRRPRPRQSRHLRSSSSTQDHTTHAAAPMAPPPPLLPPGHRPGRGRRRRRPANVRLVLIHLPESPPTHPPTHLPYRDNDLGAPPLDDPFWSQSYDINGQHGGWVGGWVDGCLSLSMYSDSWGVLASFFPPTHTHTHTHTHNHPPT